MSLSATVVLSFYNQQHVVSIYVGMTGDIQQQHCKQPMFRRAVKVCDSKQGSLDFT